MSVLQLAKATNAVTIGTVGQVSNAHPELIKSHSADELDEVAEERYETGLNSECC